MSLKSGCHLVCLFHKGQMAECCYRVQVDVKCGLIAADSSLKGGWSKVPDESEDGGRRVGILKRERKKGMKQSGREWKRNW